MTACLSLAACASPAPPPLMTELPADERRVCNQAKVKQIVQENLTKAMRYPPNSRGRKVFIETMYAQFDLMNVGLAPYQLALCQAAQHYDVEFFE